MTLAGFRIDDRLLHGQVVENWIEALRPDLVIVANERVAADPLVRELYVLALPGGVELEVLGLEDAAIALSRAPGRVFLLVGSPGDALELVEKGLRPAVITVGGLHHDAGKERLLDFVFLDGRDRAALRELLELGIELVAQDVPRRKPSNLAPLLREAPSA